MANIYSLKSGLASDPTVWSGGVVPVAGDIKLMPGTASKPAFMNVDVDTATGRVTGLF